MGKSNRIRANRANVQVKSLGGKQNKKGMPSWLMTLITVVVAVVILASVALSLLASNGVFGRMTTVVSSDKYKVTENMMAYYYAVQYDDFVTNNESLLSSSSFKKDLDAKTQTIKADNYIDSYLTGGATGTWYDFFMKQTVDSVSTVLVYCEEADALGIELTKEDKKQIEDSLDAIGTQAALYGYSLDAYMSMNYGDGVKVADVRKAMQYSALASKCALKIADELQAAITDGRINETYTKDPSKFDKIDYLAISLAETYADVQKELYGDIKSDKLTAEQKANIAKTYAERVAKYKDLAEQMNKAPDIDTFKKLAASYLADGGYDVLYDSNLTTTNKAATEADKKAGKLPEGKDSVNVAPEDKETLKKIKDLIIKNVLEAIKSKAEKPTLQITVPEKAETVKIEQLDLTVDARFATMCNTMITSLFNEVTKNLDGMLVEKANKIEDNEFLEWAFEDGRAVLNVKKIEKEVKEGDAIEGKTEKVAVDGQTYSASLYMITKLPTKDTDPTRNGAYMLFDDETKAKTAITDLKKDSITLEKFKAYAEKNTIDCAELKEYIKGSLGYSAFDTWFYDDARKENDMTDTPIQLDSYYAVAIYTGKSTEQWYVEVKDSIFAEDSSKRETAIKEKHVITVRNERVAKLDF